MVTLQLIDQTWVREHGDSASPSRLLELASWTLQASPEVQDLLRKLPPYCVVRRRGEQPLSQAFTGDVDWERVPFYGTCGVVESYRSPNLVRVHQGPRSPDYAWVPVDELEYVRPFGCLSPDYIKALRHLHRTSVPTKQTSALGRIKEKLFDRIKGGGLPRSQAARPRRASVRRRWDPAHQRARVYTPT